MNAIDLFIIYLACGAPFGVYYYFQNRARVESNLLWFKTLLNFFFWMPLAFLLLRRNKNLRALSSFGYGKAPTEDSTRKDNLHSTVKQIEKIFLKSCLEISVYEFREIIERYIGLTIADQTGAQEISGAEIEFFRVSQAKNSKLGAICLNRRNRKRLVRHQTEARKDFLQLISQLLEFDSDEKKLEQAAIELTVTLQDFKAQAELVEIFACALQTVNRLSVSETEKDLWKPELPKLSPAKQFPYQLPILKATLNSRRKD